MFISFRSKKIIKILKSANGYISMKEIAKILNLTERTVYREMPVVNGILSYFNIATETTSGKGIRLCGDETNLLKLESIFSLKAFDDSYSNKERIGIILMNLLNQQGYVKAQSLAIDLRASIQTVRKDLKQVAQLAEKHNIKMEMKKSEGVKLEGSEISKRHLLARIIQTNVNVDVFLSWISGKKTIIFMNYIEKFGYKPILIKSYRIIHNVINKYHIHLTDNEFQELLLFITVMLNRHKNPNNSDFYFDKSEILNYKSDEILVQLKNELELEFQFTLDENETNYLHWLLSLYISTENYLISMNNKETVIYTKVYDFISTVENKIGVKLNEDHNLIENLLVHIDRALARISNGMLVSNPITAEIQDYYKDLYFIVKDGFQSIFENQTIPDEEICYLVLYFVVSLEKMAKKSVGVLVVCASGMGLSKMLASRLEREIPEIYIKKMIPLIKLREEKLSDYDLIVSTISLPLSEGEYMLSSPLLNNKEIERIKEMIAKKNNKIKYHSKLQNNIYIN